MIHHQDNTDTRKIKCPVCKKSHPVSKEYLLGQVAVQCVCGQKLKCVGVKKASDGSLIVLTQAFVMWRQLSFDDMLN